MGRGRVRNWWPLATVTGAAAVVAWLLYLMWRSPHRGGLAAYGAFVFPVAAVVVGWFAWAWRKGRKAGRAGDAVSGEGLNLFADRLADAVQAQWEKAAVERGLTGADPIPVTWGRPLAPVAGPSAAAAASHRFPPLPGMNPIREADLASGQAADLHALYGGLRSGRLIIAGPPGSGKTGAAVLLLLAALRHRKEVPPGQRTEVPVPVLFTAQDWNPHRQPVVDWLTGKLQATYPLFTGDRGAAAVAALLAADRITVVLDGLDEISPALRPTALQALSRQATFRIVLLSRTSEIAAATAAQGVLQGGAAVELNPVGPTDAASYLQRTQLDPPAPGWQELTQRIRTGPDSPLSRALDSPLTLTLVRDTYHGQDIQELLDFCDTSLDGMPADLAAEAITGHLLDRVLPSAYALAPGQPPPPYDLATAKRAFTRIAAQMNQDGTRDLNWWQIPRWAPAAPRVTINALGAGLGFGLADGLGGGLAFGLVFGLVTGPVGGLVGGLVVGLGAGLVGGLVTGPITSQSWAVTLAFMQLAIEWRTPVRLMSFLDDAHRRNILRAVGPAYQFRHARLQDRLAAAATASDGTAPASRTSGVSVTSGEADEA